MILELYIIVILCFGINVIAKNMAFFQFCIYFRTIVLLNQKKGDIIKLSLTGFLYGQKR